MAVRHYLVQFGLRGWNGHRATFHAEREQGCEEEYVKMVAIVLVKRANLKIVQQKFAPRGPRGQIGLHAMPHADKELGCGKGLARTEKTVPEQQMIVELA